MHVAMITYTMYLYFFILVMYTQEHIPETCKYNEISMNPEWSTFEQIETVILYNYGM